MSICAKLIFDWVVIFTSCENIFKPFSINKCDMSSKKAFKAYNKVSRTSSEGPPNKLFFPDFFALKLLAFAVKDISFS